MSRRRLGLGSLALAAALAVGHLAAPAASAQAPAATAVKGEGKLTLLTPQNSVLLLIDFQPQMIFGVASHDRQLLVNNVAALGKSAKTFGVPTVLTTVAAESFSGAMIPELVALFPGQKIYDRTSMNTWDDKGVVADIKATGRPKLVIAALWTEVCLTMPALEALREGYDVYIVTDASGGTSKEAHDMAVQRMVQAGAIPVTWQQVMLEWQRDWARGATYDAVTGIAKQHSGAYGVGINYAKTMFGAQEGGQKKH